MGKGVQALKRELGRRLRSERTRERPGRPAGYSQPEVEQRTGICQSSLSNYETGWTLPQLPTLYRLAELYGCEVKDVLPAQWVGLGPEQEEG